MRHDVVGAPLRWLLLACVAAVSVEAGATSPAVGDAAPGVSFLTSRGDAVTLPELLAQGGSEGIVLAWFPKAFTSG